MTMEFIAPADDVSAALSGATLQEPESTGRKCGVCGDSGHNARTCPQGATEGIKRTIKARASKSDAIELGVWSKEDIATIGACLAVLLVVGTRALETRANVGRIRMEQDEADGIARPVTRIVLRRLKVKGALKGDVVDAIAIITTATAYLMRVSELTYSKTVRREDATSAPTSSQPRASNGLVVGSEYFTGGFRPQRNEQP